VKKELTDKLRKDFPLLYKQLRYFECDDGWYDLIRGLSAKLEPLIKQYSKTISKDETYCQPMASQVKEKFATLRFYMTSETQEMSDLITLYERESSKICECCGYPGTTINNNGWLRTLCESCKVLYL